MSEIKIKTKDVIEELEKIKKSASRIKEEELRRRVVDAISVAIAAEKKKDSKIDTRKVEFEKMINYAKNIQDEALRQKAFDFIGRKLEEREPVEKKNSHGAKDRLISVAKIRKEFNELFVQPVDPEELSQKSIRKMLDNARKAEIPAEAKKESKK